MRYDLGKITKNIDKDKIRENNFKKIYTDELYKFDKRFDKTVEEVEIAECNEYVTFYYRLNSGNVTKDNCIKTNAVIKHLIANNYTRVEILKTLTEVTAFEEYLKPSNLPDSLWDNSLLKKDTFYFHNTLQIVSPSPTWNPETNTVTGEELYIEMRIRYTMEDLYDYYINTLNIEKDFLQPARDIGALKHLLGLYKMEDVEAIDVVLKLIDIASTGDSKVTNPLQLQNYETDAITHFHNMIPQAKYTKSNKIIWRKQ